MLCHTCATLVKCSEELIEFGTKVGDQDCPFPNVCHVVACIEYRYPLLLLGGDRSSLVHAYNVYIYIYINGIPESGENSNWPLVSRGACPVPGAQVAGNQGLLDPWELPRSCQDPP